MHMSPISFQVPYFAPGSRKATHVVELEGEIRSFSSKETEVAVRHEYNNMPVDLLWTGDRLVKPTYWQKGDRFETRDDVPVLLKEMLIRDLRNRYDHFLPQIPAGEVVLDEQIVRAARGMLSNIDLVDGVPCLRTAGPIATIAIEVGARGVQLQWGNDLGSGWIYNYASMYRCDDIEGMVDDLNAIGVPVDRGRVAANAPQILLPEALVEDVHGLHVERTLANYLHYCRRERLRALGRQGVQSLSVLKALLDERIAADVDLKPSRDDTWVRQPLDLDVPPAWDCEDALARHADYSGLVSYHQLHREMFLARRERVLPDRKPGEAAAEELDQFAI